MILTTGYEVPGKKINEILGIVNGSMVKTKWIGKDIMAGLRNLAGGEIKEYSEMLTEARKEALARMVKNAKSIGADAVIGMRYSTSQISGSAAEILAFGTAVKLK